MKIYYLSATGNSLVTARRLARELDEDVTLESFRSIRLLPEIETGDTAVGFVFPVYFADVPREFLACIQRMKFRRNTYLFAIATCNGVPRHDSADPVRRSRNERRTFIRCILPGYARQRSDNAPGRVR